MKKKTKTIGVLLTGIALAVGIAVSGGVIHNSHIVDEVKAETGTITLSNIGADVGASLNESILTTTVNSYELNYLQGKKQTSSTSHAIFLAKSTTPAAFISNKTAIPGAINSVKVSILSGAAGKTTYYCRFGTSEFLSAGSGGTAVNITGGSSYTYSNAVSGATYFSVSLGNANNGQVLALEINYDLPPTKVLDNIEITSPPSKTSYYSGEAFDSSGLEITANYDDETTAIVTQECSFTPESLTVETTAVTASYTEAGVTKTASINVTVSARNLESIEVSSNPTKTMYVVGDCFDPSGMVITATYDEGNPVVGYTNYSYSPTGALSVSGSTMITITSLENSLITTSLQVQVSALTSMTIVADDTGAATSGYNTYTFTKNGVEFTMVDIIKNGNNIQFKSDTFSMHNSTALPGSIVGITVNRAGGTPDAYDSSSASFSWEVNGSLAHNFFRLFNFTGSSALTFSSIEIDFLSEPEANEDAISWGTDFLSATASGCSALDQSQLLTAWNGLETSYNALSSEAKGYLTSLTPNEAGNDAEHAVARYVFIVTKYGDVTFNDFMNLGISSSSNNINEIGKNTPNIAIILIVSLIGASVLVGYRLMPKKKED
jgi:hypothetical protein